MKRIDDHLHYRIIDVSTMRELCRRWNTKLYESLPPKKLKHRALSDIRESIIEARYFKQYMFLPDV